MPHWLQGLYARLEPYPHAYTLLVVAALALAAWLANWVTKRVLLRALRKALAASPLGGEDEGGLLRLRVIPRLANVVPALVLYWGVRAVPDLPDRLVDVVHNACMAFMVLTVAISIAKALELVDAIYQRRPDAHNRPIKGYLQVVTIVVYVVAAVLMVSVLVGRSPMVLLSGVGAMMAVLLLVFQDTLLSLVASMQISGDGRVRMGDWIEMPGQNADGEIIDIALYTVTVRNWDMTVTTIPTRKLISESFKNWRGMSQAGGRRIKRSILLDQHSVRFLQPEEITRLSGFALLGDYLKDKNAELERWNQALGQDGHAPVNARRMTNVGTFRAYVLNFLRQRSDIRQDMTLLVRQMQPTSTGLPLEVYCFTADTRWAVYEGIQSDIFDHLLAVLDAFGLRIYQESSDAALITALAGSSRIAGPA